MDDTSNMTDEWVANSLRNNPCVVLPDGNIRTCPVRLSFPHLFTPQPPMKPGDTPKFQSAFLFAQGADMSVLRLAAGNTAVAKWANAGQPGGPSLNSPFRDQGEKVQHEGYVPGRMFISCNSEKRPMVINLQGAPVLENEIEPGFWVFALVRPFAYEARNSPQGPVVNRGVSFGLQGVIKIAEDKILGGGGVDLQSAITGISIDAGVNPQAMFGGGMNGGQPNGQYPPQGQGGQQGGQYPPQGQAGQGGQQAPFNPAALF